MCIVVKFLSIKLNFNVDHFNWPVSIVYCFLVRVRVFVRVCVDACVFSFLRVFFFSFINSQPRFLEQLLQGVPLCPCYTLVQSAVMVYLSKECLKS